MMEKSHLKTFISFTVPSGIGKIYVWVCFLCFSLFSAQIHISEGTTLHIGNDTTVGILDSEEQSTSEIFVTSGTTVANLEHYDQYEIVDIAKSEAEDSKETFVQNDIEEMTANDEEFEASSSEVAAYNNITLSPQSTSDFSVGHYSQTFFALVSGDFSSVKMTVAIPCNSFLLFQLSGKQSNVFPCSDVFGVNHHLTSFSVRPPPAMV